MHNAQIRVHVQVEEVRQTAVYAELQRKVLTVRRVLLQLGELMAREAAITGPHGIIT
jgi:hypothetical protein